MPPPRADGSSTVAQIAAGLYVRPRTGPQSAPVWWPAVAEPQAASVPTALTAAPGDIRMDRAIPKCPPQGGGIITVKLFNEVIMLVIIKTVLSPKQVCSLERRISTRRCRSLRAHAAIDRYRPPAPDLSSKPAARSCCYQSTGQTDGRIRTSNRCTHA